MDFIIAPTAGRSGPKKGESYASGGSVYKLDWSGCENGEIVFVLWRLSIANSL